MTRGRVFSCNHHYGHAQVLRDYCSLERAHPIPGPMQHGWTTRFPFVDAERRTRWPKYVWARRNIECARREGARRVVAIGSPFCYLPGPTIAPALDEKRLLVYPLHGWESGRVTEVENAYREYAASIEWLARDLGMLHVTVCLYWLEHREARLRRLFTERGFAVTTNGHRDGDARFLHRARSAVLEHSFVTSNRVGTALFYAMSLGLPGVLHGPTMGVDATVDPGGERHREWERKAFPHLFYDRFQGDANVAAAEEELGAEYKRSPAALRDLFGWSLATRPRLWARRAHLAYASYRDAGMRRARALEQHMREAVRKRGRS